MWVLLIEDDERIARALCRQVTGMFRDRVNIRTADSYRQAVDLLTSYSLDSHPPTRFDLVISDFNLAASSPAEPIRRTGGDVLDWIRSNVPDLGQRFFFLSDDSHTRQYGVPCLGKPATSDQIRQMILSFVT